MTVPPILSGIITEPHHRYRSSSRSTGHSFRVIAPDPPWLYANWTSAKNGAAKAHYECLSLEELRSLQVEERGRGGLPYACCGRPARDERGLSSY